MSSQLSINALFDSNCSVKDIVMDPDPFRVEAGWDSETCFDIMEGR